jgi:hypothetical protein
MIEFAVVLAAASQQIPTDAKGRPYFPRKVSSGEVMACHLSPEHAPYSEHGILSDSEQRTIATNLRVAREPSIAGQPEKGKFEPETLRFIWWHEHWVTITVRIIFDPEEPKMIAKLASPFYRELRKRRVRELSAQEVDNLRTMIAELRFFEQLPNDCRVTFDGTNWFFEYSHDGAYDFVERVRPGSNEAAHKLGKYMYDLVGWKDQRNGEFDDARPRNDY